MSTIEEILKKIDKIKEEIKKTPPLPKYIQNLRKKLDPCLLCKEDRG